MNGIDTDVWNPETDPLLPAEARFNIDTVQVGKAVAKEAFQKRFNLEVSPETPLFVCLGRLADQKGIDVLLAALPDLVGEAKPVEGGNSFLSTLHVLFSSYVMLLWQGLLDPNVLALV